MAIDILTNACCFDVQNVYLAAELLASFLAKPWPKHRTTVHLPIVY